ncbi:tetratricopeptide repeat protein [Gemmatimonadota bacterium]
MNVEERKQQARLFEQQGEFADALELYEAALEELEGTPEIWRELPLYVKAGDLSLKMGDGSAAISQYEKAARAYAAYGSSKSVIALCTKILRVNPGHTHAFLRLVRLMIERDHLADARLVLLEYAERMKLPKAGFVLEDMADRPDEKLKPMLELLLELGGRYEYARAQGRDTQSGAEAVHQDPEAERDAVSGESAEASGSASEDEEDPSSGKQFEHGFSHQVEEDEGEEQPVEPESEMVSEAEGDSDAEEHPVAEEEPERARDETPAPAAAAPNEDDVHWVDDRPSFSMSTPRASRQVLFREGEARKNKPKALWIGLGAAAVFVVGGLSLVLFDVIPLGGGADGGASTQAPSVVAPADSALLAGVDLADSTGTEGDSTAADAGETGASEAEGQAVPDQDNVSTGTDDSAAVGVGAIDSGRADEAIDTTLLAGRQEALDEPPVEQVSPELPTSRGVMVQDFDIESTTEFTADGRVGFRITQLLGTGERLTLSAIYYGEDIASAPGTEEMTLAPLVGDTTTAMMHFNGYAVEARAIVSASVLETMLGRLVEVPPTN